MRTHNRFTSLQALAASAVLCLVAGCTTSTPTIDTSDDAEATFDGLYPVQDGRADQAWMRPDVDLSKYSKIRLQGVGVQYRPGGESGRTYASRTNADHYEVTEEQRAAFEEVMREAFREELAQSKHFTIVDENGPDVLLIRGGLLDVVSYVPPDPIGRGRVFLSSVGEATLVLEISDSITQTALARVVDRRAAEDMSGQLREANRVTNRTEVRRLAKYWGTRLRESLDDLASPAS